MGWDSIASDSSIVFKNFNPPTPCGVGHNIRDFSIGPLPDFNPPTPCGVGQMAICSAMRKFYFNPPTPCGVGQEFFAAIGGVGCISIHPPRVGWDLIPRQPLVWKLYFNPPTPCGVGPPAQRPKPGKYRFQSTHPVWGGTKAGDLGGWVEKISIHPPRVGWDLENYVMSMAGKDFNPPTPCGVGQCFGGHKVFLALFQSTHPVWGGTSPMLARLLALVFQSTHPVWGGTKCQCP